MVGSDVARGVDAIVGSVEGGDVVPGATDGRGVGSDEGFGVGSDEGELVGAVVG